MKKPLTYLFILLIWSCSTNKLVEENLPLKPTPIVYSEGLTARQIVEKIKAEVTCDWQTKTVDTFKGGNPDAKVTGIATTFLATLEVLKAAKAKGINFIITHEPTFYHHFDTKEGFETDEIVKIKEKYIEDNGLIVWRFHDHWHRTNPDGIYEGMTKKFGWENYRVTGKDAIYNLPPTTIGELATQMKELFNATSIRVIGNKNTPISTVAFAAGSPGSTFQIKLLRKPEVQLLIGGESLEWETVEYVRDAINAGKQKALILIGHANSEEAGMMHCGDWLNGFIKEVPIEHITAGDPFWTPQNKKVYPTTGSIERLSPEIDDLIKKEAKIEVLAGGFTWTEGPVWVKEKNYLLFSDIPPNSIFKWSEAEGKTLFLSPSGYTEKTNRKGEPGSNGLLFNANRELVLCQHGDRRIAKLTTSLDHPKPEFETIIGAYQGKKFNSPNDAIYDSQGNLYFTDPPYGLEKQMKDPKKEIDFQGVYRYSKEGLLSLITDKMSRPNGIALSPDERTLYVANSDPDKAIWMAFDLQNGKVVGEKIFHDATGIQEKGLPDGMKVDKKGNIWATGPGGVWVFNASGKVLGKIKTGEATSNCAFDTDEQTLHMTCDNYLMRLVR